MLDYQNKWAMNSESKNAAEAPRAADDPQSMGEALEMIGGKRKRNSSKGPHSTAGYIQEEEKQNPNAAVNALVEDDQLSGVASYGPASTHGESTSALVGDTSMLDSRPRKRVRKK